MLLRHHANRFTNRGPIAAKVLASSCRHCNTIEPLAWRIIPGKNEQNSFVESVIDFIQAEQFRLFPESTVFEIILSN